MTTFAVRTLTRSRPSRVPSRLQISTSTLIPPLSTPSRSYSSLRPAILTLTTPTSTRPTLRHHHSPPPLTPHRHQSRPFSVLPLLDSAIHTSQTLLTTLHTATSTPWYLTIPLFALTLNLLTRLPTTIYSRRVAILREKLHPLTLAWAGRVGAQMNAAANSGTDQLTPQQRIRKFVVGNSLIVAQRQRRWGVQHWKDWVPSLVVFPFWITGIEGLRRMCGGPRGLLGTMIFGRGAGVEEGAAARVAGAVVDRSEVNDLGSLVTGQEGLAGYVADPSMAVGGCLWFPDLTAADPLHILPLALSAILVWNVMPRSVASWRTVLSLDTPPAGAFGISKWRTRLQRGLLIVATVAGPLTMDLPAALHLYWISSATLTAAQTAILSRLMPMPKNVPKAKQGESIFVMPTREEAKKP